MIKHLKNPMMKQVLILVGLSLLVVNSFSQEGRTPKRITLKVSVSDSIRRVDFGYLAAMADSGIVMLKSPVVFDPNIASSSEKIIPYQNISEVKITRKGGVGRGILIGAFGGAVLGGIIGYISYKKPNCEGALFCWDFGPGTDAVAGATVGTLAGSMIGGIVGALAKKTFIIGGNKEKFHQMKESVLDMTYKKKYPS
jgi:outer membrane lipoprotein SlyB